MNRWTTILVICALLISANMCFGQGMPPIPRADPPDWVSNPSLSNTGNFTVSWDASTSTSPTYKLDYDSDPNFGSSTTLYTGTATQYACSGMADGAWYFRVTVSSTDGIDQYTDGDHPTNVDTSIPTPPADPSAVTGLTVPAITGACFTVHWDRLSGVIFYELQEQYQNTPPLIPPPSGGGFNQPVTTTVYNGANNSYLKSSVTCSQDWYTYRARAYILFHGYPVYGPWTSWSSQIDVANAPPGPTSLISATGSSSGGVVTLIVADAHGATSYEFKEDIASDFPNPVQVYPGISSTPTTAGMSGFELSGKADGTYYYMVRAVNAHGASPWALNVSGAVVTGNPGATAPNAPSWISVPAATTTGSAKVSFEGVTNATSYEIQEDTDPLFSSPTNVNPPFNWTYINTSHTTDGTYYYRVRAVNSIGASPWTAGSNGLVVALQSGHCTVSSPTTIGLFDDITPSQTGLNFMVLDVEADTTSDSRIETITLTASGTGDDSTDVTGVSLYLDVDADGAYTAGTDTLLDGPATFSADDGTATLSGISRTLTAGASETWLLVVDFAGTASGGDTFEFNLTTNPASIDAVFDATGYPMAVSLLSATTTTYTVFETTTPGILTASLAANTPADASAGPDATGLVMAAVTLTAGERESVDLSWIEISGYGTGDESAGVSKVTLAEDIDADGQYTAGTDRLLGTAGAFAVNDGSVTFLLAGESITAMNAMRVLVIYDLSGGAGNGETFSASLDAGAIGALGQTSGLSVLIDGLPIDGRTLTIDAPPSSGGGGGSSSGCGQGSGSASPLGALVPLFVLALIAAALRRRTVRQTA